MSDTGNRLVELAQRKEQLIARADAQRAAIRESFRQMQVPIGIIDRGFAVARFLRGHPVLVAIAVAVLVGFRRRGLLSLAGRAFAAWRLWRSASAWSAGLFPERNQRHRAG